MPLPSIISDLLVFHALVFGLGFLWLPWLRGDSLERLTLAAAAGLAQIYVAAWLIYLTGANPLAWFALPALTILGIVTRWRAVQALFSEPDAQGIMGRLLLFGGWCLAWLSLIRCYSGGEWTGDWIEHYQRALFFLNHEPLSTRFLEVYGVTSRPPLANLVVGALMALRGTGFPHAQVFTTLFSTLILLPALLLTRRFAGGRHRDATLLLLLLCNPLILQNATFVWTKLPCAFFVLAAIAFYTCGIADDSRWRRTASVAMMALGVLTHYSAAPYAIALAVCHMAWLWPRRRTAAISELTAQAGIAAGILTTWLGWAWWHYGASGTFLDNSSVTTEAGLGLSTRLAYRVHSLWVTLVPHFLRPADYRYIAQFSRAGYVRDYLFNVYQTTLVGGCGLAGLILLAAVLRGKHAAPNHETGRFWAWFVGIVAILNILSHPGPDRWGTAHIGFGPLLVTLLAFLAARSCSAGPIWRRLWLAGLAVDAALGIGLHFYLEATALPTPADITRFLRGEVFTYAPAAARNLLCKIIEGVSFVADAGPPPMLVGLLLAALATLALNAVVATRGDPEGSRDARP